MTLLCLFSREGCDKIRRFGLVFFLVGLGSAIAFDLVRQLPGRGGLSCLTLGVAAVVWDISSSYGFLGGGVNATYLMFMYIYL
ncbi:hypothetical protein B0I37DRAFT_386111 [Chaetomium sp. MPI-CAGE-AT-0009]|nr:hypothetical protein B0I37DRAFT_386111 [Chaetomium sp. MPI-CAGE-AT-0009]